MDILIKALLNVGLTLGAYFYDFKGASYKNRVISFTLFFALLLMLISWQSLSSIKRYQEQQELTRINASLKTKLTEEETKNKNLEKEPQVNLPQPPSSVPQQLSQSHPKLSQLNIQYFQRNSDPQKVTEKLKQLDKDVKLEQLSLLDCEDEDCAYQTNAIWYGSKVTIDQVKEIAKLLISSGINIKVIQPFFEPEKKPSNLVQIGAESQALSCQTWQKEEILNAKEFPSDRLGCP